MLKRETKQVNCGHEGGKKEKTIDEEQKYVQLTAVSYAWRFNILDKST